MLLILHYLFIFINLVLPPNSNIISIGNIDDNCSVKSHRATFVYTLQGKVKVLVHQAEQGVWCM